MVLVLCKLAAEDAGFRLKKSELVKRKLHALSLLLHLLDNSNAFFRQTRGAAALLRRFVVPSLVQSCVTDVPAVFRLVLQGFLLLWEKHKQHLMLELGVFLVWYDVCVGVQVLGWAVEGREGQGGVGGGGVRRSACANERKKFDWAGTDATHIRCTDMGQTRTWGCGGMPTHMQDTYTHI